LAGSKLKKPKSLPSSQLPNPGTRIQAMRALVRQKATGVRDAIAEYLDNEHEVFRREARKTLDKLASSSSLLRPKVGAVRGLGQRKARWPRIAALILEGLDVTIDDSKNLS
jgi:hypothetical protein